MRKFLAGLGSLIALGTLLIGIPIALVLLAPNMIPSVDALQDVLTMPDYGGRFLLTMILPLAAWIAWAWFAIPLVISIPGAIREAIHGIRNAEDRRAGGTSRAFGLQQRAASVMIGSIVVMFTGLSGVSGATAAELPSPSTAYSATQDGSSTSSVDVVDEEQATQSQLPTYQVKQGDTLWTIAADQLGDGKRYNEIAQLNYGVSQEDGGKLAPENHWVAPGWILELPADAGTHAEAATTSAPIAPADAAPPAEAAPIVDVAPASVVEANLQHTVQPGDTLWELAEDAYGDGTRYPEIFDASASTVQADGAQLSDPDLILPGWQVTVPGAATATAPAPAPASAPVDAPLPPAPVDSSTAASEAGAPAAEAGAADQVDEEGAGSGAAAAPSSSAKSDAAVESPVDVDETDDSFDLFAAPTMTAGGIGALLASGLLGIFAARRFRQRRQRRPGERISLPDVETAATELELRTVENSQGVEDIDRALRYLAAWAHAEGQQLPKLFALRLSAEIVELYLEEAADLPAPFEPAHEDKTAWSIQSAEIPDAEPRPTAPYPGLVTLGQDPANGDILIDLEQIGALSIVGASDQDTEGALTALALELACSRWADDLQITVVGFAPELAEALDTGRIQYVDDASALLTSLRGRARAYTQAFADLHVDGPQAARVRSDHDSWTPEIILLRHLPDAATQAELVELIQHTPRVGIAAISNGQLTGEWSLNIAPDHTATLNPAGISIRAQVVAGAEYQHILDALAASTQPATVPAKPEAATDADAVEIMAPASAATTWGEFDVLTVDAESSLDEAPEPESTASDGPEATASDVDVLAPETGADTEELEPVLDLGDGPIIRLLGTPRVENAKGIEPRTEKTTYVNPATELLAFLALRPHAKGEEITEMLWKGSNPDRAAKNRNELLSRTRRWLAANAAGDQYVQNIVNDDHYLHPDVRCDWDIFRALVGPDLATASTKNLAAALDLVYGQPFTGVPRRRYGWADILGYRTEVIATIVDVAHELAERALELGDVATARRAATLGEMVDPASEIPVRDRLRAEDLANDVDGVERVVERFELHLAELELDEAEEETQQLIDEIRSHRIAS